MESHLYTHPFTSDVWARLKLDNLETTVQQSMRRVVQTVLGLQVLLRVGDWRVGLAECPVCGAKAPEDLPDALPLMLRGRELFCEQGNHKISISQLLGFYAESEKETFELLSKLGQLGNPSLIRCYLFESGEERVVSEDPNAVRELFVQAGEKLRGMILEAADLNLAKQLAGQPGTRKKFNWCEDVALREDGSLVDVRWHGAYATELEKRLLRKQQKRDEMELTETKARARRVFEISQRA